jgi:cyanophycinase
MINAFRPFVFVLTLWLGASLAHAGSYQYFRIGNKDDIQTKPAAGTAMMGGGDDLDDAFRWLCNKGNGGDFLILRATGDDDYNSYVNGLCKLNSVATLILPNREAAQDPELHSELEGHSGSGSDQREYFCRQADRRH